MTTLPNANTSLRSVGPPKVRAIALMVGRDMGVTQEELLGRSRRSEVVEARQVLMYLAVRLSGRSVADVASIINKDQSTVRYGVRAVERQIKFAERLAALEARARDLPDRAHPVHCPPPKEETDDRPLQVPA